MARPEFPDGAVVLGDGDVANAGKVRELTPTVDRLAEECGATVRTEINAFGRQEKVATVPLALAIEAMKPAWRKDTAHQMESQAQRPTEELCDARGARHKVWSIHAEQVARQHKLKPVWRAGGRRLMVGPNGNLWRHIAVDHWEDTGKRCLTRPLFENEERKAPGVIVH